MRRLIDSLVSPKVARPESVSPLRPRAFAFCFLATACLVGTTLVVAQGTSTSGAKGAQSRNERIHFGDTVDVDVVGSLDYDWRGGLTPEGFLDGLANVDKPIFALCRTEVEVAAAISEEYGRILRQPSVVVRIVDRSNRALAYVSGAVRTPARLQLRRAVPLAELVVLAGGLTDRASGDVTIFRPPNVDCAGQVAGGPTSQLLPVRMIKISDLLAGDPASNPQIAGGDIVEFLEATPVFVVTAANTTVRLSLTPEMTLTRAMAASGAGNYRGPQKVRVHRRGPEGGVLEFDVVQIREKKAKDPVLRPFDVLHIDGNSAEPSKIAPLPDEFNVRSLGRLPLKIVD